MPRCNHSEGFITEPLACAETVRGGGQRNEIRVAAIRARYPYDKSAGAYAVPGHDCDYVEARTRLIPVAERRTLAIFRDRYPKNDEFERAVGSAEWSREFLAVMDRLWRERIATARMGDRD